MVLSHQKHPLRATLKTTSSLNSHLRATARTTSLSKNLPRHLKVSLTYPLTPETANRVITRITSRSKDLLPATTEITSTLNHLPSTHPLLVTTLTPSVSVFNHLLQVTRSPTSVSTLASRQMLPLNSPTTLPTQRSSRLTHNLHSFQPQSQSKLLPRQFTLHQLRTKLQSPFLSTLLQSPFLSTLLQSPFSTMPLSPSRPFSTRLQSPFLNTRPPSPYSTRPQSPPSIRLQSPFSTSNLSPSSTSNLNPFSTSVVDITNVRLHSSPRPQKSRLQSRPLRLNFSTLLVSHSSTVHQRLSTATVPRSHTSLRRATRTTATTATASTETKSQDTVPQHHTTVPNHPSVLLREVAPVPSLSATLRSLSVALPQLRRETPAMDKNPLATVTPRPRASAVARSAPATVLLRNHPTVLLRNHPTVLPNAHPMDLLRDNLRDLLRDPLSVQATMAQLVVAMALSPLNSTDLPQTSAVLLLPSKRDQAMVDTVLLRNHPTVLPSVQPTALLRDLLRDPLSVQATVLPNANHMALPRATMVPSVAVSRVLVSASPRDPQETSRDPRRAQPHQGHSAVPRRAQLHPGPTMDPREVDTAAEADGEIDINQIWRATLPFCM